MTDKKIQTNLESEILKPKKFRLKNWAIEKAAGPASKFWLIVLSFTESSFFPIPPDLLLIAILLAKQSARWLYYAFLTTLFSVLGGLFGYLIGYLFFITIGLPIISFYDLSQEIDQISKLFAENAFITVFISAFTPIPYKIFTITAGFSHINITIFVIASILGRGIRFFAIAFLLKLYGDKIAKIAYRYFNIFSIVVIIVVLAILFILI